MEATVHEPSGQPALLLLLRAVLRRFAAEPRDPLLRTHELKGDLADYWAFTIDDDLRVLFRWG